MVKGSAKPPYEEPGFDALGRYDIVGRLGQGSFGVVFHGRDPVAKKDVAIKVCTLEDPDLRRRFVREAEISRRLEHENIVTVHDFAEQHGIPYLVQEFLRGEDLREIIRRREPWTVEQRIEILLQIARGLAYAHTCGVIHRDIKPSNIRVLPAMRAKIMDFGIAKLANDESRLTQKGVTMGTASYLPPEQVRGGEVTHRADIFSFGVLAYELLCHQRPFRGKTISALVYQILYKAPEPLITLWPTCPPDLSKLIGRCLEKDPGKRCPDMETVVSDFMDVLDGIRRNQWPGLMPPPSPMPSGGEDEPSTSGSILSQSLIARTAQDVTKELDAQVVAAARARETQPVSHSTRPMPPIPVTQKIDADALAEAATVVSSTGSAPEIDATMDTAVTRRVPAPQMAPLVSPPGSGSPRDSVGASPGDTPTAGTAPLSSEAEKISNLVAAGHLEAAMSHLASTIERRGQDSHGSTSAADSAEVVSEDAVTQQLPMDGAAGLPPIPAPAPPPGLAATPSPPAKAAPATGRPGDGRRSGGLPKHFLVAGAAAALLLVAAAGLYFGRSDTPQDDTEATTPSPAESEAPTATVEAGLVLVATPWARILEVTDASGYEQPLPADAATPLVLTVPPGTYRVVFSFDELETPPSDGPDDSQVDGRDPEICQVEVPAGGVGRCSPRLDAVTADMLLKDSGWWR